MKKKLAGLGLILILLMSTVSFASADSAGFTTERFDVEVTIDENHVMHVSETIDVDFYEFRHGIFRYIPYDGKIYKIKNAMAIGDPYESYTEDFNRVLQIGDPYETVKGRHTYQINYDLVCYEDNDETVDYLSLDVLPPEWQTSIKEAKITVHFPKAVDAHVIQIFSGAYGFDGNYLDIKPVLSGDGKTMTITTSNHGRGQAITIAAELPEGYWVDEASRGWMMTPLIGFVIGIPTLLAVMWFLFGRDSKLVKTVEFYAPDGMTPTEVGYMADGVIDNKDLSAMIVYFADKGYLEIHEYEENKFELIKKSPIAAEEKRFAKTLFNAYFSQGDVVKMDDLPTDLGDFYEVAGSQVEALFRGDKSLYTMPSIICRLIGGMLYLILAICPSGFALMMSYSFDWIFAVFPTILTASVGLIFVTYAFDRWNSMGRIGRKGMMITGILLLAANAILNGALMLFALEQFVLALLILASLAVSGVFVILMHRRTRKSTELLGKVLGFRDFIETAELEKLKLMVEENPNYFYDIMPYAHVFGLSNAWIKHFEKIPVPEPTWYAGHRHIDAWDVYWYSRMMNRCMTSMDYSISSVVNSSSDTGGGSIGGGFSGGGFSGGGFGGGGGGSW